MKLAPFVRMLIFKCDNCKKGDHGNCVHWACNCDLKICLNAQAVLFNKDEKSFSKDKPNIVFRNSLDLGAVNSTEQNNSS